MVFLNHLSASNIIVSNKCKILAAFVTWKVKHLNKQTSLYVSVGFSCLNDWKVEKKIYRYFEDKFNRAQFLQNLQEHVFTISVFAYRKHKKQ